MLIPGYDFKKGLEEVKEAGALRAQSNTGMQRIYLRVEAH